MVPATHGDFTSMFERAYVDEMLWRNSRGFATQDEVRRVGAQDGKTYTEDQILVATQMRKATSEAEFRRVMSKRVRQAMNYSDEQWNDIEHRLILVHENLSKESAQHLIIGYLKIEKYVIPEDLSVREAFAQANDTKAGEHRVEFLVRIEEPVATDVYLGPPVMDHHDDDDEDDDSDGDAGDE